MSDDKIRRMIELARGHMEAGGVNAAGVYYRMILKDTTPPKTGIERLANGEACIWNARKCIGEKMYGAATDWYRRAIEADPLAVEYRCEYCIKALIPMDMLKNARIEAERATRVDPLCKQAWETLGKMEHALGNADAAIGAYDRAIELEADNCFAWLDRATIALDLADYDTVRNLCRGIRPEHKAYADSLSMLAMVAYREGRHSQAIHLYDKAIELGCYAPDLMQWNKALALQSIGRYREGWKAHEARGRQTVDGGMRLIMNRFAKPMWSGEPPPARLHLHQEMGYGDVIAMARYIPLLLERGYDVCVEVNDAIVSLFRRSLPKAEIVPKAADYPGAIGLKPFDYHVPMLSLPALFETDIDSVPWRGPYLKADVKLAKHYRGAAGKTGLCWSSGIRKEGLWIAEYGRRKSMKFDALEPLLNSGNDFVSLQIGPERMECREWQCEDLLPEHPTWDDTAALIDNLDLVITVDTAVAHLAGAMGKPVWLMMHTEGSWHWMTKRLDSPWYPSVQIFRQDRPHEWDGVIHAIAGELEPKMMMAET